MTAKRLYHERSIGGGDPYVHIREALAPEYALLAPEELEDILQDTLGELRLEELEEITRSLDSFGRVVGKFLRRAGPGMLRGAVRGAKRGAAAGPWGALIGGALGSLGGGLKRYVTSSPRRTAPARTTGVRSQSLRPPVPRPRSAPVRASTSASPAAAQLLGVLTRPETLRALMAMVMGQTGARQVPIAGRQVPVTAITNLIGSLANRASVEQNALIPAEGTEAPEYLLDDEGRFVCDPAVPEERAQVVLELLERQIAEEAAEELQASYEYDDEYTDAYANAYEYEPDDEYEDYSDEEVLEEIFDHQMDDLDWVEVYED